MKRILPILLTTLLLPLVEGCAVYNSASDFFVQRYVNVVAYFNTYYNAKGAFEDGEKEILQAQRSTSLKTSGSAPASVSPTARQKFNTAIEKSSRILSFYPTSKWVDAALMIIGKSYYYLGDDLKADRKFLELIAKFPNSSFVPEAELWHGKSLYRKRKATEGEAVLTQLYSTALSEGEKGIAGQAEIVIGQDLFDRQDYANALTHLERGIALSDDQTLNTQVALTIGFAYDNLGDYAKAASAFHRVADYDPDYASLFESRIQEARMLVKERLYPAGLAAMEAMLSEGKNSEYFGRIKLEIANTYLNQGKIPEATDEYVIVDTTYGKSEEGARAAFALAQMAEMGDRDYPRAKLYYDQAKVIAPSSTVAPLAAAKSDVLMKYFVLCADIAKYDSLLRAAEEHRGAADSTRTDSTKKSIADTAGKRQVTPFVQAARILSPAESIDSLRNTLGRSEFELAGVFYLQLDRPDSAARWYATVIDSFPRSEFAPRALFILADLHRKGSGADTLQTDSLYSLIVQKYPQSPYAVEARRRLNLPPLSVAVDRVGLLYDSAEVILEGKRPADAIPILNSISDAYPRSPLAPKALYALGWLYENKLDRLDSASAVYRRLAERYPTTEYAIHVEPAINGEDEARRETEAAAEAKAKQDSTQQTLIPPTGKALVAPDSLQTPTRARKPG